MEIDLDYMEEEASRLSREALMFGRARCGECRYCNKNPELNDVLCVLSPPEYEEDREVRGWPTVHESDFCAQFQFLVKDPREQEQEQEPGQ